MKIAVNFRIDVKKLDKSRFYVGAKGTYADLTCFIDIDQLGQYGDNGLISQQTSKEERDAGLKMPICGDVKVFWRDDGQPVVKQGSPMPPQVQQQVQQLTPQAPPQAPPVQPQINPANIQQAAPVNPTPQQQMEAYNNQPAPVDSGFVDFDDDIPF